MNKLTKQLHDALCDAVNALNSAPNVAVPTTSAGGSTTHRIAAQCEEALRAYGDQQEREDSDDDAAGVLVHAFAKTEVLGGSADWAEINRAYRLACEEVGQERLEDIKALYDTPLFIG